MLSSGAQQSQIQQDDPVGRNARIRLDYKKSFEDDLLFFPDPECESIMSGLAPPERAQAQADAKLIFHKQQQQQSQRSSQQKDNLVLLMALKRLEKQQQQQQQQQRQQQQQQQLFYENQLAMRKEATLHNFYQQQQDQHIGEHYIASQNIYNYVNLRARG